MLENQTRSLECCVNLLSLAIINNWGDCFNKESMLILITEISAMTFGSIWACYRASDYGRQGMVDCVHLLTALKWKIRAEEPVFSPSLINSQPLNFLLSHGSTTSQNSLRLLSEIKAGRLWVTCHNQTLVPGKHSIT